MRWLTPFMHRNSCLVTFSGPILYLGCLFLLSGYGALLLSGQSFVGYCYDCTNFHNPLQFTSVLLYFKYPKMRVNCNIIKAEQEVKSISPFAPEEQGSLVYWTCHVPSGVQQYKGPFKIFLFYGKATDKYIPFGTKHLLHPFSIPITRLCSPILRLQLLQPLPFWLPHLTNCLLL